MTPSLIEYQQLILYDKLVIAKGKVKIKSILMYIIMLSQKKIVMISFSFFNIALVMSNPKG